MNLLQEHALEILTTILGLIYIFFEYKASSILWIFGIIMPSIDIYLFAAYGMYAYAGISFIFAAVAVYGLLNWKFGGKNHSERLITCMTSKKIIRYFISALILCLAIYFILIKYTDSNIPLLDSFTTASSFIGLIALAYKYVEQWIVWIIVDIVSVILFINQGLYFRACLYAFYIIVAIQGYRKWKSMAVSFQ